MGGDAVGEIGFMCHEQDGGIGGVGDGLCEVGLAGRVVVDAGEKEVLALTGSMRTCWLTSRGRPLSSR